MNSKFNVIILVLISSFFASCGGAKKGLVEGEKLKNYNWKELVDTLQNNEFNYEWIKSKASADVIFKGEENSVKANIRIRNDSATWVNISKTIQIITTLASYDSIKVLKKVGKKEYYVDDFNTVNRFLNTEVDYSILEDFFAGNAIGFDYEAKYKAGIDEGMYMLSSDKVKKMDKILRKGNNKNREILYRCWVNPTNFKCQKVAVDLLLDSTSLIVKYNDWQIIDGGGLFPHASSITLKTAKDTIVLNLEYNKVEINEVQDFPFKVTDSYEPMIFE